MVLTHKALGKNWLLKKLKSRMWEGVLVLSNPNKLALFDLQKNTNTQKTSNTYTNIVPHKGKFTIFKNFLKWVYIISETEMNISDL